MFQEEVVENLPSWYWHNVITPFINILFVSVCTNFCSSLFMQGVFGGFSWYGFFSNDIWKCSTYDQISESFVDIFQLFMKCLISLPRVILELFFLRITFLSPGTQLSACLVVSTDYPIRWGRVAPELELDLL